MESIDNDILTSLKKRGRGVVSTKEEFPFLTYRK